MASSRRGAALHLSCIGGGVAALAMAATAACSRSPPPKKSMMELATIGHAETLAVDGSSVYWTSFDKAAGVIRVEAMNKAGAAHRIVAQVPATRDWMFDRIAVDDGHVYWFARSGTDVSLWGAPKAGGTPVALAPDQHSVAGNLVTQGGRLYWTTDSEVRSVPVTGGATVSVASTMGKVGGDGLVVDTSFLFWVNGSGVFRAPLAGGSPVLVTTVAGRVPRLASSPAALYVTSQPGPLGSGPATVLEA